MAACSDTWGANFETLPGASMDPNTAQFWMQQPLAWAACRRDLCAADRAMPEYAAWPRALPGRPVFVGWYLVRFADNNPFGFSVLDIKSFTTAVLGREFRQTTKRHMPQEWFDPTLPHAHVALDDALEQGALS